MAKYRLHFGQFFTLDPIGRDSVGHFSKGRFRSVSVGHPWENDIPKLQLANTNMTATASSRTLSQYQQQQDRATTCHKSGCKKKLYLFPCVLRSLAFFMQRPGQD